jgi:hypothetical protein
MPVLSTTIPVQFLWYSASTLVFFVQLFCRYCLLKYWYILCTVTLSICLSWHFLLLCAGFTYSNTSTNSYTSITIPV